MYRSILRPLSKLQEATRKIRDGNLDFTLDIEEDDEIGELCQDFEEMRIRLKESAEQKIQYDNENKELISNISHDLKTPITAIKAICVVTSYNFLFLTLSLFVLRIFTDYSDTAFAFDDFALFANRFY